MNFSSPLDTLLPPVSPSLPESDWIHTTSVTGPYGITASVKDWAEVIDWQEHRRSLTQGYYRLIPTPQVRELTSRLEARYPGRHAVALTSAALAEQELLDACAVSGQSAEVRQLSGLPDHLPAGAHTILDLQGPPGQAGIALLEDADLAATLFERNRRRGGALSARVAESLLYGTAFDHSPETEQACAERLCDWEEADHALFYPSGMAAVTAALQHLLRPDRTRILVLGNVYRDTHLLLEEQTWAGLEVQTDFLDTHDLEGLADRILRPGVAAVLVETITNPLIEIPDLPAIARHCQHHGIPLLVDSTMAGPLNATPLALGADVLIHSTSKYVSGGNTHGGGVILTRDSAHADALSAAQQNTGNRLAPVEFPDLLQGLSTYPKRLARFNRNGEAMAELLRSHPAVETVYYGNQGRPDWLHGLGGVVSCDLTAPNLENVACFFDAPLPGVIKAPSLGSDQTLFCPYVLLAYYDKSDAYLRESNLSKTLLRFAMGSEEDITPVLNGIRDGLDGLV